MPLLGDRLEFGSSPLARGALSQGLRAVLAERIIPARAGSTWCSAGPPGRGADHPRSRGEHIGGLVRPAGTPRIIPARAGSTCSWVMGDQVRSDHPRSRGEHYPSKYPRVNPAGSSPLARGARRTPRCRSSRGADHPRSRGEHRPCNFRRSGHWGSSPLARGALQLMNPGGRTRRIIPARAGSTSLGCHRTRPTTDHPRSRGEHCLLARAGRTASGSSPLARGAPPAAIRCAARKRIIPARAGSTI